MTLRATQGERGFRYLIVSTLRLVSFGFLHLHDGESPPHADRVVHVRHRLSDPADYHQILSMLEKGPGGRASAAHDIVLGALGAGELLDDLAAFALVLGTASVSVGCAQGHDRSVALVELLAAQVRAERRALVVEHRHVPLLRIR